MARRSVPSYCLHKATGQAYVKIDGRRIYLGLHGTPESHRKYAAELARWQQQGDAPPEALSVGQLTMMYTERCKTHYRKHGKQTTEVQGVRDALKRLNALYRAVLAREFTASMLIAVRQQMIGEGLARTTINRHVGRIRRMFRWAIADGRRLVPAAVLTELEAISDLRYGRSDARETAPVKPVPDAWVDAVKPFVSRQVWGLIEFQRSTGARPGEALIVRPCDLNASGDVWEYRPAVHKTEHHGRERIVFVGPKGQAVLQEFMTPDLQRYVFHPGDAHREMVQKRYRAGAKVRQDIGEHYTLHSYAAAIRRACVKAKVPHFSANQLRHNFATMGRRAAGLDAARTALGHAHADTTQIYAERDFDAAKAVVAKIG